MNSERPSQHRPTKPQVHNYHRHERTYLRPSTPSSPLMEHFAEMDLADAYRPEDTSHFRSPYVPAPEPPLFDRPYGTSARRPVLPIRESGLTTPPVWGDYFQHDRNYERLRGTRDYFVDDRPWALQREWEWEERPRPDEALAAARRRMREVEEEELQARREQMYRPYPTRRY